MCESVKPLNSLKYQSNRAYHNKKPSADQGRQNYRHYETYWCTALTDAQY